MIICGYQGCGKTTYCKNHADSIDLDSSIFIKNKDWEIQYVRVATSLSLAGYKVFISAHREVIEFLLMRSIDFALLIPAQNKEAWRHRLEFRYQINPTQANKNALLDFEKNFDRDMDFYSNVAKADSVALYEISAKVVTNIGDFI